MRSGLVRGAVLGAAVLLAAACSNTEPSTDDVAAVDGNRYSQTNLAADKDSYHAQFTLPGMVNAWGLADRPKGAGGHSGSARAASRSSSSAMCSPPRIPSCRS